MRKLIVSSALIFLSIFSFAQETKYVNTSVLNVRAGAGTNYEIVVKIDQGEKVVAISTQGTWTEIETSNGKRGFVSTKFLSDSQNIKENAKTEKTESNELSSTPLFVAILVLIVLFIVFKRYSKKCGKCKKWNAMKTLNKEVVGTKQSHVTKERTQKNSQGEVISRWKDSVPATVYTYHTHRMCKHCGYKDYLVSSKKKEN